MEFFLLSSFPLPLCLTNSAQRHGITFPHTTTSHAHISCSTMAKDCCNSHHRAMARVAPYTYRNFSIPQVDAIMAAHRGGCPRQPTQITSRSFFPLLSSAVLGRTPPRLVYPNPVVTTYIIFPRTYPSLQALLPSSLLRHHDYWIIHSRPPPCPPTPQPKPLRPGLPFSLSFFDAAAFSCDSAPSRRQHPRNLAV